MLSLGAEPPLWPRAASCWVALESPGNLWSPLIPDLLCPAVPLTFGEIRKRRGCFVTWINVHSANTIRWSKHHWPLWVLPTFLICILSDIFLCSVFPVLPLPPSLLPLLLFRRLAAAGDDAVQYSLVSVRVSSVSFYQCLQLVPHDAVLFIPGQQQSRNIGDCLLLTFLNCDADARFNNRWTM